MGNMSKDEEIHLDLAILMVKALLDARVQGMYNLSSSKQCLSYALLLAADKKLFCQTLSRLYLPDDADENKLRTLKFLMNSFKQVYHSTSLFPGLGRLLTTRDIRTDDFQMPPPRMRSNASTSYWKRSMLSNSGQ
jgi:hypothetical protein